MENVNVNAKEKQSMVDKISLGLLKLELCVFLPVVTVVCIFKLVTSLSTLM